MTPTTIYLFLAGYLFAAAYVLFGIVHMVSPRLALAIYRTLIGRRLFARYGERLQGVSPRSFKILGALLICFGMLITWSLMNSFQHLQQVSQ
jgi:hypothetical protein